MKYEDRKKTIPASLENTTPDPLQGILVDGETVIESGVVHWGIFIPTIIYAFLGLLFALFFHPLVGIVIWLMTLVPLVSSSILYVTTRLVLTNKRVFARYGFFNRDLIQIRLDRLESAHIEQPFLGQFLGYSTVNVMGTGTGVIPVRFIANGTEFVHQLEKIILK